MKAFLIISLLFTFNVLLGQKAFLNLSDKAFDFYQNKKQFDSALFYYQQINQQFPSESSTYINNQIADCYLELHDTTNAELSYLKCLSVDKSDDSLGLSQTASCLSLSKIYYNRSQYREALTFLDYTKTKYRPIIRLCQGTHGGYEGRLTFAYKKSLCYFGLNKMDSAIIQLAPLIFRPREDVYLDSLDFDAMTQYFVKTVFAAYGITKAQNELKRAIQNLSYHPSYEDSYNIIMCSVDCSITFAKTKIQLNTFGAYQVDKKEEIPEWFSKQTLLKEFTDSPAYEYIMTDKCQVFTSDAAIW